TNLKGYKLQSVFFFVKAIQFDTASSNASIAREENKFLLQGAYEKFVTIPHSTFVDHFSQSYDSSRQRWFASNEQKADIIANDRNATTTIIEGSSGTGDTSIGGSGLKIAITAHHNSTEHLSNTCNNRGGGGGGGARVSCGGQSPPTPTLGKTLLNTSGNLLPITTASDTFNNLKNLVKIDKAAPAANNVSSSYRPKANSGYKNGVNHIGSPKSSEGRLVSNGQIVGKSGARGASAHFSTGFNKNSAKIRQHDSEVSPRPRRSYQSDSSSPRYYNKNSDNLGQVGQTGGSGVSYNNTGRSLISESSGRSVPNSDGRRNYQNNDGGYNRNVNSINGGGYRQQNSRFENGNGNHGQQRQYSANAGYNHYNNKSYNSRGSNENNVNLRSSQREDYGNNYRDYEDTGRSRYTGNNNNNNTDSLERTKNGRYKPTESGGSSLPPSALRQGSGFDSYDRTSIDNRNQNNRTPPIRSGNAVNSAPSSNSTSSSSRGISPNYLNTAQQPAKAPTPPPPSTGRWVPPSLRPQHGLTQTEKNDVVFRKVRGILNKLTPEKFQELSDELLKLDLNTFVILKGVILLIFDKALDEPKYSSMYAQLCKRLSEEALSFEKDPNSSNSFLQLLIAVCRDKFNNRLKRDTIDIDANQFNSINKSQSSDENDADEEERRHLAKQRMLGNVKFIGELNKLDMLSKNVLHQCIMELLDKKKKRTATPQEMCEDMECLAQLLKTCGKNLDSEQGKELMNHCFEKLERRSKSTDFPPRIRFMLKDVIELRENNWVPRKIATTEGPVPIKQIRTDDDAIIRTPFVNRNRDMRNDRDSDSWMNRFHLNLQPGFNDMFGSLSVTGSSPMMSPFANNTSNRQYNNRERNNQGNNYNNRFNKHNNQNVLNNNHRDDMRNGQQNNREQMNTQYGSGQINSKEIAPRFKRNLMSTNQDAVENLQMRPAANSLLFKAASQNQKLPAMLPISTPLSIGSASNTHSANKETQLSNAQYPMLGTPTSHLMNPARPSSTPSAEYDNRSMQSNMTPYNYEKGLKSTSSSPNFVASLVNSDKVNSSDNTVENHIMNDKKSAASSTEQLVTKQGSVERQGAGANNSAKQQKKDKAFNKDEVLKKTTSFMKEKFFYEVDSSEEDSNEDDTQNNEYGKQLSEVIDEFVELKIPEKCLKDICINLIMDVLDKADEKFLDRVVLFLKALRKQYKIKPNVFNEIFKQITNKMNEREALNPRITTFVAYLLCKAVGDVGLIKLNEISNYTDNGQHYPLFLLVLQQLHRSIGKDLLEEKFRNSKIELMNSLPEADRNKARLAEILDDRNLAFLYPLLKVQAEMIKQLNSDGNPAAFYKWIKANVDLKHHKEPGFINALMTVILKHVTQETSLAEDTDIKKLPDKSVIEKEENLLLKYCQVLCTFLNGNVDLQLVAVYALQVFCYNENFPKGMLCRWFKYLYEAEVIEEEPFITWKDEISDTYPGKGTALFQVNTWLTWLQEAESEDDDD
ncbi:eukaryotic translation initiation factor 4 gamma 2, partial [Teleopsis dalmanni]|uniref:eukaryotic translation initiation factor 4 gamma 2 n=1 Tax=Teleopsis dalmanni TaxID=139649 RepID=UPI0018CF1D07